MLQQPSNYLRRIRTPCARDTAGHRQREARSRWHSCSDTATSPTGVSRLPSAGLGSLSVIVQCPAWADTEWPGRLSGSDSAERYRAVCRRGMAREVSAVLNLDRRRERIEPAFVDTPGHQCADPDRIGANVTDTHASSARKPTTSPGSIATGMSLSATDHVYQRCPPSAEGHEVGATDQVGTRAVTPAASRTRPPWRLHPCRARRTGPLYPGPSPSRDPAEPGCRLFGPRSL